MLAKSWKKILLVILIIACLWNIISKLAHVVSFGDVMDNYKARQEQKKNTDEIKKK